MWTAVGGDSDLLRKLREVVEEPLITGRGLGLMPGAVN